MPIQTSIKQGPGAGRPQPLLALGCLLAAFTLPAASYAAENPGTHEHGHAVLQLAVEGNRIDLMFTSPAYNLAGFEHEARTDEQKDWLAEINQWLETTALVDTETRGCRVTGASVRLGEEMEEHHGEKDHHDHHHDHHGHEDDHGEATHREYDVSQQLACESIGSDQEFTSALMEKFQNLEELTIEWVTSSGQGSTRLTSARRVFTIKN